MLMIVTNATKFEFSGLSRNNVNEFLNRNIIITIPKEND